uniref:Uncharacterized protein n=1 Tax=Naja naja TaxID=35670 RepID=A0A8C6YDC5_NAJNA
MHDDEQRRAGDKNQLQGPETDMGDGEKMIIANIGATRLPVVAVKILLLISPHPLSSYHINKDTKNKDHREPDAAKIHGDRSWRPSSRAPGKAVGMITESSRGSEK